MNVIAFFKINVSLIVLHRIYSIIKTVLDLGCQGRFNQISSNVIISNNNKSLCCQGPCFLPSWMDGWMDGWMENGYVGRQMDEYMDGSGGRTVFQRLQSQRLEYQLLQFTFGPCERHWTPNCSKWLLHLCVIWMNDYWWAAGTLHYHVKYPQVHVFISSALSVLFFIVVSNSTLFPKPLALSVPHYCDCLIQQNLPIVLLVFQCFNNVTVKWPHE